MEIRKKVLVIDDENSICYVMQTILVSAGYDVITATTGASAIALAESNCPDLILLDLGLPDMDGMEVLRRLREWASTPVIVVSARGDEQDKVAALENGADDYISKPFGTKELLARIRVALRHADNAGGAGVGQGQYTVGGLVIDYGKYRVYVDGVDVNLTQNEFRIVSLLGKYAGRVLTYDFLIKSLWGPNAAADNQILRVNMANIRRKVEKVPAAPRYILTEVGVGYRLADE